MMRSRTQDRSAAGQSPVAATFVEWGLGKRAVGLLVAPRAVVDLFSPYASDLAQSLCQDRTLFQPHGSEGDIPLEAYAAVKQFQARPEFDAHNLGREQCKNERTTGVLRSSTKKAPIDLIVLDELDLSALHPTLAAAVRTVTASRPRLCVARLDASAYSTISVAKDVPVWRVPGASPGQYEDFGSVVFWQQLLDRLVYALTTERLGSKSSLSPKSSAWKKV